MTDTSEPHTIVDDTGEEFVQKPISIDEPVPKRRGRRPKGVRVRVYNKLRTRLHCSDCVLEPESEGEILRSDLNVPAIADNTIKVGR